MHGVTMKIHFNIILPSTPSLPSGLFPSSFPTKILYAYLLLPIHATRPVHLIPFELIIRIMPGEHYRLWNSSLCSFLQFPSTSSIFGQNIFLNARFSNIHTLCCLFNVINQLPSRIQRHAELYLCIYVGQEISAIIRCRTFCLPGCYPKI